METMCIEGLQPSIGGGGIKYEIVSVLPSVGKKNITYLVQTGSGSNKYQEYVWINGAFELVGDAVIKAEVTNLIEDVKGLKGLSRDLAQYTANENYANISVGVSGKAYNTNGVLVDKEGYAISSPISITKGNVYLFKSSTDISDVALFTHKKTINIQYDTKTESIGNVVRPTSKFTAKGEGLVAHTYTYVYNTGNNTNKPDDIKDNETSVGATFVIPSQYIEYVPMFSANGVVARPISGYYCLVASVTGEIVISAKEADIKGSLIEVRYGVLASIINNLARKADIDEMSNQFAQNEQIVSYALNDLFNKKTDVQMLNKAMAEIEVIISTALCLHDKSKLNSSQVAPVYSSETEYSEGDYCFHNNIMYRCLGATKGKPFTPSMWASTNLMAEIKRLINQKNI